MKIVIFNELNNIDFDFVFDDKSETIPFDFSILYPNDKEETGEPVVIINNIKE